jgi:hypothetical protein
VRLGREVKPLKLNTYMIVQDSLGLYRGGTNGDRIVWDCIGVSWCIIVYHGVSVYVCV